MTINQAVSLTAAPGAQADITAPSATAIFINAGPSDIVVLHGLTIRAGGIGSSGIDFETGGTLRVENCVVSSYPSIFAHPPSAGLTFMATGTLRVRDSVFTGNVTGIFLGAFAPPPTPGTTYATIDRTRFEANTRTAFLIQQNSKVAICDSVASDNLNGFFAAPLTFGFAVDLSIENCLVNNNGDSGIVAFAVAPGSATVRVSNSTVTHNDTGLNNVEAVILSRGNNTVEGNLTADTSGTIGSYTAR